MPKGLGPPITKEEFAYWYSPKAVSDVLKKHFRLEVWRPLLIKRLLDDDAQAAARKVNVSFSINDTTEHFPTLTVEFWTACDAMSPGHAFWDTDDLQVGLKGAYNHTPKTELSCVDVRFDPEGIRRMIPAGVPRTSPEQQEQNLASWGRVLEPIAAAIERSAATAKAAQSAETASHRPKQRRRGPKPKPYWTEAVSVIEADISSGKLRWSRRRRP